LGARANRNAQNGSEAIEAAIAVAAKASGCDRCFATAKLSIWSGGLIRFALLRVNRRKQRLKVEVMDRKFKVGDHVNWNSEAGHVNGRIVKVHDSMKSRATRPITSPCTRAGDEAVDR